MSLEISKLIKDSLGVVEFEKNFHQPCSLEYTTSPNVEDLKNLLPIKNILLILAFNIQRNYGNNGERTGFQ